MAKMIRTATIALAALMWTTGPVAATFFDGHRLREACQSTGHFYSGVCGGYVIGVIDGAEQNTTAEGYEGRFPGNSRACWTADVSKGQLLDAVEASLEKHPEERHRTAASLVGKALAKAFPCKE
jgi:hypothetical protein